MNKKLYYAVVLIWTAVMIMGLLLDNPRLDGFDLGYILHSVLAIILFTCLWLYPKYKNHSFRIVIIITASTFLYTVFFLYPGAWSTFIFLCLIPAISILFFDSKLFYFSLILNALLIIGTFSYIIGMDQSNQFSHIKGDLAGNAVNFIGSQVIIYLIYHVSYERIKKQQLYYEQLQHSERLKTTGQLAAAVAHEIRNPLTVVKGFLQLYSEKDCPVNTDIRGTFTLMIDELNTAEEVISQFLTIAKPDKDKKLEIVNVHNVLQSVTDLLKSYGLLRDNKIDLQVDEDCYICANNIEYKQLMINIIKNALEASNIGNSVIVKVKSKKQFVEMKVIDYGDGMSEEEIKSLGTPFYSLKSNGTGLGLMICYHIIEKYNGSIDFQSSKGQGTTVTICFPSKNCELIQID
ncbi:sensor histidine kinase [Peribacillus asahii]|uniref:sensor histidine kinase n=1 Tax=Peribacillus asahii TaxID=228899 RepID=UPI00207A328A|nr:HAMP domain-containing sensor histidine kinase [Peribacillus asahii]USK60919.1 HAMP domain-containing histidine kinase [Peribacillus asahii]